MTKRNVSFLFVLLFVNGLLVGEPISFTTIGNISANAQSKLGSQVSGRIEEVYIDVGDKVQKGQALAKLDSRLFEVELSQKLGALKLAKIELNDAETNFQRMKKLWQKPEGENPSISQKRYEDAAMRFEQAKVQVTQAQGAIKRAKINLEEATIKASFSGVVTQRFIDPGESVTSVPIIAIVEIQSQNPLYLEFSLPQTLINSISIGVPIVFEVDGSSKKCEAHIDCIYPSIDVTTRSVKCRAIVENSSENLILPGSLAKVEINIP